MVALGKKGGNKGKKGSCHSCGKLGHFAANCPSGKGGKPSTLSGRACFRCGKPGHLAYQCTLLRVYEQGKAHAASCKEDAAVAVPACISGIFDDRDGELLAHVGEGQVLEGILDSGAVNHVMDRREAPGYSVLPSEGSRRGQVYTGACGEKIANGGAVCLDMEALGLKGPSALTWRLWGWMALRLCPCFVMCRLPG